MKIFTIILAILSLIASASIFIPAPNMSLLPLGVAVPELVPWIIILNIAGLVMSQYGLKPIAVIFVIGLLGCAWPLSRIAGVQRDIAKQFRNQKFALDPKNLRDGNAALLASLRGINVPQITAEVLPLNIRLYRSQTNAAPILVDIYGGAWQHGSPADDEKFHRYLAGKGYSVFAIDYRHAPAAQYPAQIDDVRAALIWIYSNAAKYNADPERIALCGRSAGGQLALLAAYTSAEMPGKAVPIQAVISFYGPSDLTRGYNEPPSPDPIDARAVLSTYLGGTPSQIPQRYRDASPITYANRSQPPTLLIQGAHDHIVKPEFAAALQQKLIASGNRALLLELPWSEHAFDAVFSGLGNVVALPYIENFLADTMGDTGTQTH